jgi:SAM-dependent methyltransferase
MATSGMPGYFPTSYGDGFADVYDEWYPGADDTAAAVAFLDDLATAAAGGAPARVLELAAGTGRLAVPLSARHQVTGLDVSAAMLGRLAAADPHRAVTIVTGDMADAAVYPSGPFDLVVVAYNSLFMLTEPDAQQACFAAVAGVLAPGGAFVVEAFVPRSPPPSGSDVALRSMRVGRVVLAVSSADPATQQIDGQYIDLADGEPVRLRPWRIRYTTPAQLDEMAGTVGMRPAERYEDVARHPFRPASDRHVTVYRHAEPR